ncbi:Glycerophosphoryl diester phosphodiesterase [Methylocapsa palsarum]|uniref:Glycerophosphoryl diester phosphodiesterase n=2 Tax=Methylocapsa palsarum TaxID=1612308 RepID=A0A1I3XYQ0_9HYPH|nr:Glycerophosphoryl diester phosphodiesterase [Methylocapsa palsarum]
MRAKGDVAAFSAGDLAGLAHKECDEGIATLSGFLAAVAGRTPVIVEIKSRFDGDVRLAARALAAIADYAGPVGLKTFDPRVLACLRAQGASRPLGLVAEACYETGEWLELAPQQRAALRELRHFPDTRPDFLSWNVNDLPHAVPMLCRAGIGMPVMTWTVRSPEDRSRAELWADQIVFEGFEA